MCQRHIRWPPAVRHNAMPVVPAQYAWRPEDADNAQNDSAAAETESLALVCYAFGEYHVTPIQSLKGNSLIYYWMLINHLHVLTL
ncbi:hypothetical protein AVEN_133392-1 [Araneus ventricosus]|uniref:Uncharacterized protein n=1 Tax=Araneus ventricosus TaxID=182803 RepID=A0A4Y2PQW4_ARAVE|nr:hypothetical protein AVEN_133392-1 [Araneus ventricosus]